MQIIVTINNCTECRYIDHSGAFTKEGKKLICDHDDAIDLAVNNIDNLLEDDKYHWKYRVIQNAGKIPSWCPLKNGSKY